MPHPDDYCPKCMIPLTFDDRVQVCSCDPEPAAGAKYKKPFGNGDCRHDVYDVLDAFNVTSQPIGHAIKKLLMAGKRGHKDRDTDLAEAIQAITREREMTNGQ